MDPETITSIATLVGAVGVAAATVGTGIWKLIARADRIREQKEERLIANLQEQIVSKNRTIRWHEQVEAQLEALVNKYREQLIRNGIEPEPAELPAKPPREESS